MSALILGSSPNALVAAGYLAHQGHKVTVVEPLARLGGPFESSHGGEQGHLSLALDPTVLRELELNIAVEKTLHKTAWMDDKICRLSHVSLEGDVTARDQERWPAFVQLMDEAARLLHASSLRTSSAQGELVEPWRALGERTSRETLRLPWMTLKDLLEEWFESDVLKGALAFLGLRGVWQGPFACGTVLGLLQQWSRGEVFERHTSSTGVAGIVESLVTQLRERGVEFRSNCLVAGIEIEDDTAVGLRLEGGEVLRAAVVVSDCDAAATFRRWISPRALETSFNQELAKMRYNGCVARANFSFEKLPEGLREEDLRGGVILTPGLWGTEKAYDPSKYGRLPSVFPAEVVLTSANTLSVWAQYFPYRGADARGALLESLKTRFVGLELIDELLPADLATRFGLTEGHLGGGELTLSQSLFLRPTSNYVPGDFPVRGLHLCGATTHPGGYSGLSGRLAAQQVRLSESL